MPTKCRPGQAETTKLVANDQKWQHWLFLKTKTMQGLNNRTNPRLSSSDLPFWFGIILNSYFYFRFEVKWYLSRSFNFIWMSSWRKNCRDLIILALNCTGANQDYLDRDTTRWNKTVIELKSHTFPCLLHIVIFHYFKYIYSLLLYILFECRS